MKLIYLISRDFLAWNFKFLWPTVTLRFHNNSDLKVVFLEQTVFNKKLSVRYLLKILLKLKRSRNRTYLHIYIIFFFWFKIPHQNEKEEKKDGAIRKLKDMRQKYLDLRAKRTNLRKKYQALLALWVYTKYIYFWSSIFYNFYIYLLLNYRYNELLTKKDEQGKEASDSSSSSESEDNDDNCCIM